MDKVIRHGKPSKAFTSRLRGATSLDFDALVAACLNGLLNGSEDVLMRVPYTLKFPKGFPKGIRDTEYDDGTNVHKIKARKLLAWLCDNGHTGVTMEDLTGHIIRFGLWQKRLDDEIDAVVQ